MDFTYFFAAFIGLIVGLASTVFHLSMRKPFSRGSALLTLSAALLASGATMIRWSVVPEYDIGFIMGDLAILGIMTSIGCIAGAPLGLAAFFK